MPTIILAVPTISCAGCVAKLEKALAAVTGVSFCSVSLVNKTVHVEGGATSSALIEALAAIGFPASVVDNENENRRLQQERDQAELNKRQRHTLIALGWSAPLMGWMLIGGDMTVSSGADQLVWGTVGLITLLVMGLSGRHFFTGFWNNLKVGTSNMDTLVALGTGSAWLYSMLVVLLPTFIPEAARHVYFEASAMIIGLINLGQSLELKGRGRASQSLNRLLNLQPPVARRITDTGEEEVPVAAIHHGDRLRIVPGSTIPVDGTIIQGSSHINEAMLTGEPLPVAKQVGDTVSAGTLNRNGSIIIEATRIGSETALARVIQLVTQAQNSKMPIARVVDKVAGIFVPVVIVTAILAALCWYAVGPAPAITHALIAFVTVLIIACPCALGLATPMSMMLGIGKAAELGMLVRQGTALQLATKITTVVLDKTGTITAGTPTVAHIHPFAEHPEEQILLWAAALEQNSEHPLADAIMAASQTRDLTLPPVDNFRAITGRGVQGQVKDDTLHLGNALLMTERGVDLSLHRESLETLGRDGQTVMLLARNSQLVGAITVTDPIREDSASAIARLHKLGIKVVMMTGDNATTAQRVAKQTGIDNVFAETLPEDKERHVRELQSQGEIVGMVGDGINDAPALARADIGFALGTGTDIAMETADITLIRDSLHGLADAVELSRATLRNIHQNLFGAFIYNVLGIPVAAGVLYPFTGLLLNPMVAAAAMALSSVTVISNANRLRHFQPSQPQ